MRLDSAVCELLGLDPEHTSTSSGGGGGCSAASTIKITSKSKDGGEIYYFMKTGKGNAAKVMFEGEHASLSAIHTAVPDLCPRSYGQGHFTDNPSTYFLVTDYLDLSGGRSDASRSSSSTTITPPRSLAKKLAQLHSTSAPIPKGYDKPQFGFPVPTCCGDTAQVNDFREDWAEFYAENRIRFIGQRAEKRNGKDKEIASLIDKIASKVIPRLLSSSHLNNGQGVTPVVVHGDLWSGNASRGVIGGKGPVQDVIYDSSACYAHSEFELGIMKMFGGFGTRFLEEYHREVPKTEPVEEYEDRVSLYELYHHLNHYSLFGGGYRSGAVSIMEKLIRKYGAS